MLYVIHDEKGKITQANKVWLDPNEVDYDQLLRDRGLNFLKDGRAGHLPSHDHHMVSAGELIERPAMSCHAIATMIKAGTAAVILEIPKGAAIDISAANASIHSIVQLDGTELEFNTEQVPCIYTITIRLWPFKDSIISIEAAK